jgi:hypothetical protein
MSIGGEIMKEVEGSINRGRSDISRFLRRTGGFDDNFGVANKLDQTRFS